MPRVPSSAGYFFDFGSWRPSGFVVHTSAFTAHSSAIPGNSGFSEILTRTLGTITCAGSGWGNLQASHPRTRLSGASHLVGLTVEGWHSQTTCTAMPGKTLVSEKLGDKYAENAHFRMEKTCRGYPLRLGYFFDFRELETQWVL